MIFSSYDLVAAFAANTRHPSKPEWADLVSRAPIWALAGAPGNGEHGVGCARVTWINDSFDFYPDGDLVLAVLARNEVGDFADITAFSWVDGRRIGAWLGAVPALGMNNVLAPRLEPALKVHATAWDWLCDRRDGLVPIDEARTAMALRDCPLIDFEDRATGERFRALFTRQRPRIRVSSTANSRSRAA